MTLSKLEIAFLVYVPLIASVVFTGAFFHFVTIPDLRLHAAIYLCTAAICASMFCVCSLLATGLQGKRGGSEAPARTE